MVWLADQGLGGNETDKLVTRYDSLNCQLDRLKDPQGGGRLSVSEGDYLDYNNYKGRRGHCEFCTV